MARPALAGDRADADEGAAAARLEPVGERGQDAGRSLVIAAHDPDGGLDIARAVVLLPHQPDRTDRDIGQRGQGRDEAVMAAGLQRVEFMQGDRHVMAQFDIALVIGERVDIARGELHRMPARGKGLRHGLADIRSRTEDENRGSCHNSSLSACADRNRPVRPRASRRD